MHLVFFCSIVAKIKISRIESFSIADANNCCLECLVGNFREKYKKLTVFSGYTCTIWRNGEKKKICPFCY